MSFDLISLIFQAGLIVKLVLLLLLGFSLASLTIIVTKWLELRAADQDSEAFLEVYRREGFSHAYDAARHLDRSPLAVVFLATGDELNGARSRLLGNRRRELVLKELERSIAWSAAAQSRRLERGMPFLATTGSATPFIGLFGTVVGIIAAFQSIGVAGQASLAVVGPGIAEALVATAVGLLAAIPATIAYNTYAARIDQIISMLDRFISQFEEDLGEIVQVEDGDGVAGGGFDPSDSGPRSGTRATASRSMSSSALGLGSADDAHSTTGPGLSTGHRGSVEDLTLFSSQEPSELGSSPGNPLPSGRPADRSTRVD